MDGLFDIQCNDRQYPKTMQPSHARWEDAGEHGRNGITNGSAKLLEHASTNGGPPTNSDDHVDETIFKPLPAMYSNNFMIHDIYLQGAPHTSMGLPGLDSGAHDIGSNGMLGIDPEILEVLPPECRGDMEAVQAREVEWKSRWLTEGVDGNRAIFLATHLWTA